MVGIGTLTTAIAVSGAIISDRRRTLAEAERGDRVEGKAEAVSIISSLFEI